MIVSQSVCITIAPTHSKQYCLLKSQSDDSPPSPLLLHSNHSNKVTFVSLSLNGLDKF